MKKISRLFVFLAVLFTSLSLQARTIEIARDNRGGILKDHNGNCIRTKWMTNMCCDPCGYESVVYVNDEKKPTSELIVREKMIKYADLIRQSVYFDNDMFNIDQDDRARMEEVINEITKSQGVGAVRLVGYADRHSTDAYNIKLSRRRALAVLDYFNGRGYFTDNNDIKYGFYGERRPVTSCSKSLPKTEQISCLQADRRVDIEVEVIRERIETVKETVYKDAQGNIISSTNSDSIVPSGYTPNADIQFEDVETLRRNVQQGR